MSNDLLAKGTRTLLRRVHQAARVQAVRLAWRRDRRLRVSGKYFGRIDMENGWTARVVLRLARRRIDPAPNIRDRSIHEWREAISEAVGDDRVKDGGTHSFSVARRDGLTFLVSTHRSFAEGLRGTLFGTSARRLFEHAHRLRHRDLPAPIPLGYAEQREGLVTTRSFIILPNDSTYRCAPQQVSSTSTPGSCGWIEGKPIETGSIR